MGKAGSTPDEISIFGYGTEEQKNKSLLEKLTGLETEMLEFKSTMRWNIRADRQDKEMENIIMKSIAAFNNRYGGTLMIGVNDDGDVIGLEKDYQTFREKNKDHFELHLRNLINENFGKEFATSQISISFPIVDDKEFCQVDVKRGRVPKYLQVASKNGPKVEKFYVRSGNSSQELSIEDATKYINQRFRNNI
jgi:predicted HTH transcriptional regulator